jgi:serine/threonine-protein kinase
MKPERWQRIEQIYNAALEQRPGEREAFLQQACAGNESLRAEVESLLGCASRAQGFIEQPAIEEATQAVAAGSPESYIGRAVMHYSIDREIGRGGMGGVYKARDSNLTASSPSVPTVGTWSTEAFTSSTRPPGYACSTL